MARVASSIVSECDDNIELMTSKQDHKEGDVLLTLQSREVPSVMIPREPGNDDPAIRWNFVKFSVFLAAVPASALACLGLATAELGNATGSWQSALLYLSYTLSSVSGATVVVHRYGSLRACVVGASLFCLYILCFWAATTSNFYSKAWAEAGALMGGVGAGILWTGQGVFFAETVTQQSGSSSDLGGTFAFWLLLEETLLDATSTVLTRVVGLSWNVVFAVYSFVAVGATLALALFVNASSQTTLSSDDTNYCRQMIAALDLLVNDSKAKYLIGFNVAFGWSGAFLNSFISGQVVPVVLSSSTYIGLFVAWHGAVAAFSSLLFKRVPHSVVLSVGCVAFASVGLPLIVSPNFSLWQWPMLLWIYGIQGLGRATYEGALRAQTSDWFADHKEGAFANLILQNGLATGMGYFLALRLDCSTTSIYCWEYANGNGLHNFGFFAGLVVLASVVGLFGYWRAWYLYKDEESKRIARRQRPKSYQAITEEAGEMT